MKTRLFGSLLALALLTAASAVAQSKLEATIPFEFFVGKKLMPAGEYIVDHGVAQGLVVVRCYEQRTSAAAIANGLQKQKPAQEGKLVFHRYGSRHFLSEIWRPGYTLGRQLLPTSAEREMALDLARERVEVAAVLPR